MSVRQKLARMRLDVGPNMTPMVDIVMCILIFFMLQMSLTVPEMYLKSNTAAIDKQGLGAGPGASHLPDVRTDIRLSRVMVGGKPTTVVEAFNEPPMPMNAPEDADQSLNKAIADKIAEKKVSRTIQILIVPDRDVPWQNVVTLYDTCVRLEFKQVAFAPVQ